MKIGELAKATGHTTKTIRFYEARLLLPEPPRTVSRYRVYGPEDVTRLDFIRKAKRLGLSLEEIRGILQLHDRQEPTCHHVRGLLDQKLAQIDQAIADLTEFRSEMSRLRDQGESVENCKPAGARICSIIEESGIVVSNETLGRARPYPARS